MWQQAEKPSFRKWRFFDVFQIEILRNHFKNWRKKQEKQEIVAQREKFAAF